MNKRMQNKRARAGFSLAELMVVIVILGLLATLVVPNVVGYLFKASREVAKSDISALCQAIDSFVINNSGKQPDTLQDLITPDANGHAYLKGYTSIPKDPWKNEYNFEPGSPNYRVWSYGKDGLEGGEGDDADIDNVSMLERK